MRASPKRWSKARLAEILSAGLQGRTEVPCVNSTTARSLRDALYGARKRMGATATRISVEGPLLVIEPADEGILEIRRIGE
jgi:hypothetical protein